MGIVGLQDMSLGTGTGTDKNITSSKYAKNEEGVGKSNRPNMFELRRMSIHSSCRRQGYGAVLVRACISHAKQNKFDGIKLYTGSWMDAAINFYTKMGFEDRGRVEYKHDGGVVLIAHLEMMF